MRFRITTEGTVRLKIRAAKLAARVHGRRYVHFVAFSLGAPMLAVAISPSFAASCNFEAQGEGRVSAVIDARTFKLEDGREVRLAGMELADPTAGKTDGADALAALISNRDVTLRSGDDTPDRWGRQSAFVFVEGQQLSVQTQMLDQGAGAYSGATSDKGCAGELVAAESRARQARRGIWTNTAAVIKNAESPGDILARMGQFTVVEGKVVSAREAGATFYLNFGRRWTRDFAVTISRRMMPSFETAGVTLKSLENRRVRVRGWVDQRGGPRIELLRVGQIEVIGK